jgi:hypothetical protein
VRGISFAFTPCFIFAPGVYKKNETGVIKVHQLFIFSTYSLCFLDFQAGHILLRNEGRKKKGGGGGGMLSRMVGRSSRKEGRKEGRKGRSSRKEEWKVMVLIVWWGCRRHTKVLYSMHLDFATVCLWVSSLPELPRTYLFLSVDLVID